MNSEPFQLIPGIYDSLEPSKNGDLASLVAYLTCDLVIDYTAMSDFFLTFRMFTDAGKVLELLFSRLVWAICQVSGEHGRDVGVRTFVVIRHWINNFFADDFLANVELRQRTAWVLNSLTESPEVQSKPVFSHIMEQLKRVWVCEISNFWSVEQPVNLALPVFSGGDFESSCGKIIRNDPANLKSRRLTLLRFYNGPIQPNTDAEIVSQSSQSSALGSLVKGGVLIDGHVGVPVIKTSPIRIRPKKSIFFRMPRHHRNDQEPRFTPSEEILLDGKVDVLALRVVEELNSMLPAHHEEMASLRRSIVESIGASTIDEEMTTPPGSPLHSMRSGFAESERTSLSTLRQSQGAFPPTRDNTMDTLDMNHIVLANTSSESELDIDDADDADDADDVQSTVNLRQSAAGKWQLDLDDIAYVDNMSSLSSTSASIATSKTEMMEQRMSAGTFSLLSEQDNEAMAPCRGFNSRVAADLAAIPDEDYSKGDAVLMALQKLEGTYETSSDGAEQQVPAMYQSTTQTAQSKDPPFGVLSYMSGSSGLYSHAFASRTDIVSQLAVHDPPPTIDITPKPASGKLFPLPSLSTLSKRHAPFVLSLTAEEVCEQMTLIERDALEQIDWKELVELRWSRESTHQHSWLQILAQQPEVTGVSLVSARFDLVVGWVKSEITLCHSNPMKAQSISRFIHIAEAARTLQNYATLMQIVLALTSQDLNREHTYAAWALVAPSDKDMLARLDALVSPKNNFAKLRRAQKSIDFSKGCIPFAGLSLTDLVANNERTTVGFSKYQTAASIVRSLIQSIEWSKNYNIRQQHSLLSKCLYLQSLSTAELDELR